MTQKFTILSQREVAQLLNHAFGTDYDNDHISIMMTKASADDDEVWSWRHRLRRYNSKQSLCKVYDDWRYKPDEFRLKQCGNGGGMVCDPELIYIGHLVEFINRNTAYLDQGLFGEVGVEVTEADVRKWMATLGMKEDNFPIHYREFFQSRKNFNADNWACVVGTI